VAQPRANIGFQQVQARLRGDEYLKVNTETLRTDVWFRQFYSRIRAKNGLMFSFGIQTDDWGPGELTSPTNFIFKKNIYSLAPFYELQGQKMARFEVIPNSVLMFSTSVVAASEKNTSALAKLEINSPDQTFRSGIVLAGKNGGEKLFGAFAEGFVGSPFSIYSDGAYALRSGSNITGESVAVDSTSADATIIAKKWKLKVLAGAKIDAGEFGIFRAEYLLDEAEDLFPNGVMREDDPLEKDIVHASYLLPDVSSSLGMNVFVHYLHSLSNSAGLIKGEIEFLATDSFKVFAGGAASFGTAESALTVWFRQGAWLGTSLSW
jgi:hypothetical protein